MSYPRPWGFRVVPMKPEADAGAAPVEAVDETPAADADAGEAETPETEAPQSAAQPEGQAGAADPEPAAEPEKPKRDAWWDKRIAKLTAENKAAQERAEQLAREADDAKRQVAAYQALYGTESEAPSAPTAPAAKADDGERRYTQAELQREAAKLAALNTLNQKLEGMFQAGKTAHGAEFETRITAAAKAFPELANRVDLFAALADLDNGTDVYHALAGDLDQMDDVLSLDPLKLGMRLAKMSAEVKAKPARGPQLSKAPPPIEPLGESSGGADVDLDKTSMDDFVRLREKQIAERRAGAR